MSFDTTVPGTQYLRTTDWGRTQQTPSPGTPDLFNVLGPSDLVWTN